MAPRQIIRSAIEAKVNAWATANSLPIIFELVGSQPTTDHVEVEINWGQTATPSLGNKHQRFRGTVRVLILSTKLTNGPAALEALSGSLADQFPNGSSLVKSGLTVNFEGNPYQGNVSIDGSFAYIPVEVSFRCEVYN